MALRGTLTHWKTRTLAGILGIQPCFALGLLEALWHTTAELAPAGNIGRLPNNAIALEMFYEGDADALMKALVKSGHLDEHDTHRLVIHDWLQHSDYNTKRKVARRGESMVGSDGVSPVMTRHKSIPEPVPVPVPEPEKETGALSLVEREIVLDNPPAAKASPPVKRLPVVPSDAEVVFAMWPVRLSKEKGLESIRRALANLANLGFTNPRDELTSRVRTFLAWHKRSVESGKFTPEIGYAQGWFGDAQKRYLDDTSLPPSQSSAGPRPPSAQELIAQEKAEALAKIRAEEEIYVASS